VKLPVELMDTLRIARYKFQVTILTLPSPSSIKVWVGVKINRLRWGRKPEGSRAPIMTVNTICSLLV
jgi:hypothetical protein